MKILLPGSILLMILFSTSAMAEDCDSLRYDIDSAYDSVGRAEDQLIDARERQDDFNDIRGGAEKDEYGRVVAAGWAGVYEDDVRDAEAELRDAQRELRRAESNFNRNGCSGSGSTIYVR